MPRLSPVLLLAACGLDPVELTLDDTEVPEDTEQPPDEPTVTQEDVGSYPEPDDAWVFTTDVIHEIAVELPQASWDALIADPYTLARGAATVDGVRLDDIGVRLRGKIGSFRPISGKPKLKLDFNAFVDQQRLYGLEALSLNNSIVDCSSLKDMLGMAVMRMAGLAGSRTAFAHVTVNGADYGLYVIVETQDDRFLRRNFADADGNLYDGKYVWYGGHNYTLLDFLDAVDEGYSLEEGEDVGNQDIFAVTGAVASGWGTGAFMATTAAVVDWDAVLRLFAAEQWVRQNDGYVLNTNNYRVYFNPETGLAELIPWDLDYAFMPNSWGYEFERPRGVLASGCLQEGPCVGAWRDAVAELDGRLDVAQLQAELAAWDALTYDAAVADPRRECAAGNIRPSRDWLHQWLVDRPAFMRATWGL